MPTYTENFGLLRFGGTAWSDTEEWSCGLKLRHIGGDAAGPLIADVLASQEAVADAVQLYVADSDADFSAGIRLNWMRFNAISKSTGKYLDPNSPNYFEYETAIGGQAPVIVPQVAYCVTLRGLPKRGPAARGRWFVPTGSRVSPIVTSTGVMPAATALLRANAAGRFLEALQDISIGEGPNTWNPYLFGDGIGGPQDSPLTTVSVGNVYDTQRRRRNQLEETYSITDVFP